MLMCIVGGCGVENREIARVCRERSFVEKRFSMGAQHHTPHLGVVLGADGWGAQAWSNLSVALVVGR